MAWGVGVPERLQAAMSMQQYSDVASVLDSAELESRNPEVLEDWPHALHLLGHIYNKNLEDARFVWKRIPPNVKQNNPELQAVWRLLQLLWQRQYPAAWQALHGHTWSPALQPLLTALAEKLRGELLDLVGTAYTTVRPSKVAALCGLTEQEALAAAQAAGWRWDASTGMLHVVRPRAPDSPLDEHGTLQQLTQYMAHLEQ